MYEKNMLLHITTGFYPKYFEGNSRANNVDPDQTAPKEQSDQSLHCLQTILLSIL